MTTTASAVVAMAVGLVCAAPVARAETLGELELTFPTPDAEFGAPACTTTLRTSPGFTTGTTALGEHATVRIWSNGCGAVRWLPEVFILDEAPRRALHGAGSDGAPANPATASTSQTVDYGVGVREVGVITMYFSGRSRLGFYCVAQRWEYDAVRRVVTPTYGFICTE